MVSPPLVPARKLPKIAPLYQDSAIQAMPYDVLRIVFDYFTPCIATCLGLTCKKFYTILKSLYPTPINLFEQACSHGDPCFVPGDRCQFWNIPLHSLLINWSIFKTQYRFSSIGAGLVRFLNVDVYGRETGPKQLALESRVKDHQMGLISNEPKTFFDNHLLQVVVLSESAFGDKHKSLLPRPYNRGESWYQEAIDVIRADAERCYYLEEWVARWTKFSVFQENLHLRNTVLVDFDILVFGQWSAMMML